MNLQLSQRPVWVKTSGDRNTSPGKVEQIGAPAPLAGNSGELFPGAETSNIRKSAIQNSEPVQSTGNAGKKETIIDAARKLVVKEIVARVRDQVPCVERFEKYLRKLSLSDLVARRKQLEDENQRELFPEGKES